VTTPDELKQGERWGLNFAKGTALRNPKDLNLPPDAPTPPTSDVTTDEKGQPMAAVKISTKDASKGKFTIEFYADSAEPKFARQTMSVDRFEDLSTEPGWRAQMFKLADTNQEPAKEQKVKGPQPLSMSSPEFEPENAVAFLANYEGLKLLTILQALRT